MPSESSRRLGRPRDSSSAETRHRILDVARGCFAEFGFEGTTNKTVASAADITTAAIYHYFESKVDTYVAVYESVQTLVYDRFDAALNTTMTFREMLGALLDTAHDLNNEDPTLAQFLGSARVDFQRYPGIATEIDDQVLSRRTRFFAAIVDRGIATGEITAQDRSRVLALIETLVSGLTDAVSGNEVTHQLAVDAIKALVDGTLVGHPNPEQS
jgi:AcrR family transcriptional regulator